MTATPRAASKTDVEALKKRRLARQSRLYQEKLRTVHQRTLVSPEGAELSLNVSSASARLGAMIIDFLIFFFGFLALVLGLNAIFESLNAENSEAADFAAAVFMVLLFFGRNFYWIIFESGRRAATPGKRLLGLRVVARNGGHLSLGAILARNFTREIEVFWPIALFFYLLNAPQNGNVLFYLFLFVWVTCFLFFPVFNRDKLRMGDIIAGTWVIRTPKIKLLGDISSSAKAASSAETKTSPVHRFTKDQLDVYGIHELQVLESVLRSKQAISVPKVASKIREKIDYPEVQSDRKFLEDFYKALREHLEQALLLGRRKEDKYDTL